MFKFLDEIIFFKDSDALVFNSLEVKSSPVVVPLISEAVGE